MFREIGSNFWQYMLETKKDRKTDYTYYGTDPMFFKSGRNAIRALLKTIKNAPKRALLPLYTCQTVIDPFLEEGWELSFYDVDRTFCPCLESMKKAVEEADPTVILSMHYFGFRTIPESVEMFLCQEKRQGRIVVEDVTQSLYSDHRLTFADYTVSSLRKFFAVPDGGFLSAKEALAEIEKTEPNAQIDIVAKQAFDMKAAYTRTMDPEQKTCFRQLYARLKDMIEDNGQIEEISAMSRLLLDTEDISSLKAKRRENLQVLLKGLQSTTRLSSPIRSVEAGDVPLFLPVYVRDRREVQAHLAQQEIYCPIIWPVPQGLVLQGTQAQYIYDHILCIPVDQRYTHRDMARILRCLEELEK